MEKDTQEVRGDVEEGVQKALREPDKYLGVYFHASMRREPHLYDGCKYTLISRRAAKVNFRPVQPDPNGWMHWISMQYEVSVLTLDP